MKHYKTGLVIGRFQPFHSGHIYLLEASFALCDALVIVIGSSNKKDRSNPFSYLLRKEMIEHFLKKEGYTEKVKMIFSSIDIPDDYAWRDAILKKAGSIDVVIGNNQKGSNIFFAKAGYPIHRVSLHKRYLYEGTRIRKLMQEKKPWENRVPSYVEKLIKKNE